MLLAVVVMVATACSADTESGVDCSAGRSTAAGPSPDSVTTAATGAEIGDTVAARYESVGDPEAEVVVVVAQGGPVLALSLNRAETVFAVVDLEEVHLVLVHQAQTIDPDRFLASDISFEEAQAIDAESVELLIAAVRHFKEQEKQVFVVGQSFGAFVVQDMLARQEVAADGYLLMVGRLDMPVEAWGVFADGDSPGFVDGTDVILRETGIVPRERNMARLAGGLAHRRYTELLAKVDLCDVVYITGDNDERVGRLSSDERDFLESRGAEVIVGPGRHGETIEAYLDEGLAQLLGRQLLTN